MSNEETKRTEIKRLLREQKIFWTKQRSEEIAQLWREIDAISRAKTG